MIDTSGFFLAKANESLQGAESELANGRLNNCANRTYYACFQAAIAALLRAGIRPTNAQRAWQHAFVLSQFTGQLVNRRHVFARGLRETLPYLSTLRRQADYRAEAISRSEAIHGLDLARSFVQAVQERSAR